MCLYVSNQIIARRLEDIEDLNLEVLWLYTRPRRLPRGVPCLIVACIYHPPLSNDNTILEYLNESLSKVEGLFPGCAIILAGDFNQLNIKHLSNSFQMKQLVKSPTRGSNILDLVLTNIHRF